MKTVIKWSIYPVCGTFYAVFAILLSRLILQQTQTIAAWLGTAAALEPALVEQIATAAAQLKTAVIVSPWLTALLTGALAAGALRCIPGKGKPWIAIAVGAVALLPAMVLVLFATQVNGIRVFSVLRCALALL